MIHFPILNPTYFLLNSCRSIFSRAVSWERSDLSSQYSVCGYVCMFVCVWTVRIIWYNIFSLSFRNIIWYNIFSFSLRNIIWYNIFSLYSEILFDLIFSLFITTGSDSILNFIWWMVSEEVGCLLACLLACLWTVTKFALISNIHTHYNLVWGSIA